MHHGIGLGLLVAAIAFAFGERAARAVVAAGLIVMAAAFVALIFLAWTDRI